MGFAKRAVEYSLIILVAFIVAFLIIYFLMRNKECTNCGTRVSVPAVRDECNKQFSSFGAPSEKLQPGEQDEYLLAFNEVSSESDQTSGFSSATSSDEPPDARQSGFVIVRVQPQSGWDYSGNQTSSTYGSYDSGPSPKQGDIWNEVVVTVAQYASELRNDAICAPRSPVMAGTDKRFEFFCDIPIRFGPDDPDQHTYRVFVNNESAVPIEYCMLTDCDDSAPWGNGKSCRVQQQQLQAFQ